MTKTNPLIEWADKNRAMTDCCNSPPPLRQTELVASETLLLCT
ncbi:MULTISPECIES: hypothetical protein [unclassified Moraxella]